MDRRRLPARGPELAERGGKVGGGVGREGRAHGASLGPCAAASARARLDADRGASRHSAHVGEGAGVGGGVRTGFAPGFLVHTRPRWKDDEPSEPGSVAESDRTGVDDRAGAKCQGWPRAAVKGGRQEGGRRAREHDTPGSQARAGRAGRGAGRARRPHAAARPLVAQPGGHRGVPHRRRRLRHVGGLPELPLLRGGGRAPRPHLAAVLAVHHRQLRARHRRVGRSRGGGSPRACWRSPFPAGSGPPATTTARPTTGASGSPPRGARWPTATPATPARRASRSSCRTCTATSSCWP